MGYDAASRIGFLSDLANPANSNTYAYDALDRLTQAVTPGTPFAYSYDAVGNRLSMTVGASTDTYTYSATSNRLASITPGAGPVRNYTHDSVGSVTADGANTYAYDSRGRLVQAVSVIGATSYQVNSLGQRIAKLLPGGGGGDGGATLFSDTFPGPEGRAIDDQPDGLWKDHGPKQVVARVRAGQAEIAPRRHIRSGATFPLPAEGLVLTAKLVRGKLALTHAGREDDGLVVRYAGERLVVVKARDDDGDEDDDDDVHVKRRFKLAGPGAVLNVQIELQPGRARVRLTAGAETLDTGDLALPEVRQGERYRIRLGSIQQRRQALSVRAL